MLLANGANVNAQSGLRGTALQAASSNGHDKIVEMLLASGTTVTAPSRCYRPDGDVLQASSSGGHDKIAERLLAKGANANARSRRYGTALQASSSGGHDNIVEVFLEGQYTHGRRLGDYSDLFTVRTSARHVCLSCATAKVRLFLPGNLAARVVQPVSLALQRREIRVSVLVSWRSG